MFSKLYFTNIFGSFNQNQIFGILTNYVLLKITEIALVVVKTYFSYLYFA